MLLMHPKEFKQEKAATGRLTHLCLANSVIQMGIGFDEHEAVQALIRDPRNLPLLLYPGHDALNLSDPVEGPGALATLRRQAADRTLTILLLDATWSLGRKMLRLSPSLQALPRVMFTPGTPSRYVIKQQPAAGCLSTLEAVHELLTALERAGLDEYPLPGQLLDLFDRMQAFQIRCATDPARPGYRRTGYRAPAERQPLRGRSRTRREKVFQAPRPAPDAAATSESTTG